jgi:hypothetical protein
MDSTLEAQRNVEIETKTTFGNLKGVDISRPLKNNNNNEKVTKSKDGGWRW